MTYGVTSNGFVRKRLVDIKSEVEAAILEIYPSANLLPESPLGQLVGLYSFAFARQWEQLEDTYNSFNPDTASGDSLNNISKISGVSRNAATATRVVASVEVPYGGVLTPTVFSIPLGSVARESATLREYITDTYVSESSDISGYHFATDGFVIAATYTVTVNGADYSATGLPLDGTPRLTLFTEIAAAIALGDTTVDADVISRGGEYVLRVATNGTSASFSASAGANVVIANLEYECSFYASVAGAVALPIGGLDTWLTTVSPVTGLYNWIQGTAGKDTESDSELRLRRYNSVTLPSSATVDAVRSEILDIEEVVAANVFENRNGTTDLNGIPPHSLFPIVRGGTDAQVAAAIFRSMPGGIGTHGTSSSVIQSSTGQSQTIYFGRPVLKQLHATVVLQEKVDGGFPTDGLNLVKESIVNFVTDNLSMGKKIYYSDIWGVVTDIPGHEIITLTIGLDTDPESTVSIAVEIDELIVADEGNIDVTIS